MSAEPVVEVPEELELVVDHYKDAEAGRSRNARIAFVAATYALLVTLVMIVALWGWQATTNTLETRNKAVTELTDEGQRQAKINTCQDTAFVAAFDSAVQDQYSVGDLSRAYQACLDKYPPL